MLRFGTCCETRGCRDITLYYQGPVDPAWVEFCVEQLRLRSGHPDDIEHWDGDYFVTQVDTATCEEPGCGYTGPATGFVPFFQAECEQAEQLKAAGIRTAEPLICDSDALFCGPCWRQHYASHLLVDTPAKAAPEAAPASAIDPSDLQEAA